MTSLPDRKGHFLEFGGKYVPETLSKPLQDLEKAYLKLRSQAAFKKDLAHYLRDFAGRETPLYLAQNWGRETKGVKIYLKREDLCHTGAHKINNTIGQVLLARFLGKKRIVAETGAGQHGVASATAARLFDLQCDVYMGAKDVERQALNVYKMKLLGARVIPVQSGSKTLKDATNEAIRDWVTNVDHTHYLIGSVVGPHPYPMIVRDFQSVIGKEARRQILRAEGRLPDKLFACVGGGSNAMGFFYPFLKDTRVKMVGVEAAGHGIHTSEHAATLSKGSVGILHGMKSYLLQDAFGQVSPVHSISAGLDYPSVGPEHAYLKKTGRVDYQAITDREALQGFYFLTRAEGIMPALETSHAVAYARKAVKKMKKGQIAIVCLSGRGDKDISIIQQASREHGHA